MKQSDMSQGKLRHNFNRMCSCKLSGIPGNHEPKVQTNQETIKLVDKLLAKFDSLLNLKIF